MGGNLERAQPERLENLQEAVVGRRFQRYRVARPRHRAQCEVERLHAAGRGDDVAIVEMAAPLERAACDRPAQLHRAGRAAVVPDRLAVAPRARGEHAPDALEREHVAVRAGAAEANDLGILRR